MKRRLLALVAGRELARVKRGDTPSDSAILASFFGQPEVRAPEMLYAQIDDYDLVSAFRGLSPGRVEISTWFYLGIHFETFMYRDQIQNLSQDEFATALLFGKLLNAVDARGFRDREPLLSPIDQRTKFERMCRIGREYEDEAFGILKARAEALDRDFPLDSNLPREKTSMQTFVNVYGGNIGVINTGTVNSINAHLDTLSATQETLAKGLGAVAQAAANSEELSREEIKYVLENLDELSRQATLPPNERMRGAAIKSLLSGVAGSVATAGGLAEVWSTWGEQIRSFFGV